MSNRRKSRQERIDQPNYGAKTAHRRPMFNFDFAKLGRFEGLTANPYDLAGPKRKDRALSGKDRVRARRGQR